MTTQSKKRLWELLCIAVAVIAIVIMLSLRGCERELSESQSAVSDGSIPTEGILDYIPYDDNNGKIRIPVIIGMSLKAYELEQTVDFYNPKVNNCYFIISLYLSDNTLIYKSALIAPDEHITNITLLHELQRGKYRNCKLVYNCVAMDGVTPLNGSDVAVEINTY